MGLKRLIYLGYSVHNISSFDCASSGESESRTEDTLSRRGEFITGERARLEDGGGRIWYKRLSTRERIKKRSEWMKILVSRFLAGLECESVKDRVKLLTRPRGLVYLQGVQVHDLVVGQVRVSIELQQKEEQRRMFIGRVWRGVRPGEGRKLDAAKLLRVK